MSQQEQDQDQYGKYIRLFGTLFFTFICFIVAMILLLAGLRFFFGLLSYIPWITNIFTLFIICVPAALFISVYLIYFYRTKTHPSFSARIFSYIVFTAALSAWVLFFVKDMFIFFKHYYPSIGQYNCYDLVFLVANVFSIFLVGIVQALAIKNEGDWMERRNQ